MKTIQLRQIIREEISKIREENPTSSTPKTGTVSGGSISTLVTALKGIGIKDNNATNILGKLKNAQYKPSVSEKDFITNVFRQMMNTNEDQALLKVFTALKNMEVKNG